MKLRQIKWEEEIEGVEWSLQFDAGGVRATASLFCELEEMAHYEVCDSREFSRKTGNPLKWPVSVHYQWDQVVESVRQVVRDEKLRIGGAPEPLETVSWIHRTEEHDGTDWVVRLSRKRLRVYRNGELRGLAANKGEEFSVQDCTKWPAETMAAFQEALNILKKDVS